MTPTEIAAQISKTVEAVRKLLGRLVQDKLVEKTSYGRYMCYTNIGTSGTSSTYGTSGTSGTSSNIENNNQDVPKSDEDVPRRTKTYPSVTGGDSAVESIKQGKTYQTDCIYKDEILSVLRREAMRPSGVWSIIGRRDEWPIIEASINTLLAAGVIAWDEGNVHLVIAT
jgi:hypothetical protein